MLPLRDFVNHLENKIASAGVYMSAILAKIAISLLTKLITETFLARLIIEGLRVWARQTENTFDDKVIEEAARAFGVPVEVLKVDEQ
jgi:hypothetical protein